jgi:aspartate-semialdehyde dehydrogenase
MRVAVLGATGAVGRVMLRLLEERLPEAEEIVPLASARSAGEEIRWRGRSWRTMTPTAEAFRGCAVALFSAGAERSREWAAVAAGEGATVVDNSSAWRMDPDVPLVVPEVNPARVAERPKGIIANPNCSTIQLVLPLEALRRAAGLGRVVVSTYQSVSGAGQKGLRAYRAELGGGRDSESPFPAAIVGNVIPRIGGERPGGWTEEEEKMRAETRKILELPGLAVAATCVRVPVEVGHAVSAVVELERALSRDEALAALSAMPGLELIDGGPDPLPTDVAGTDAVRVARLRVDPDRPNVVHMWIVADNLRKGAATNAVQIASLVRRG